MSPRKKKIGPMEKIIRAGLIPGYDPFADAGNCWFDEKTAAKAVNFFPTFLRHRLGPLAGKPYKLEPHEKAVIANLFGWKRPDGKRRYHEFLLYVPKKNSKTTLAAGIAMLVLFFDSEPGMEIYVASGNEEQARYLFETAAYMVDSDEELKSRTEQFMRVMVVDKAHKFAVLTSKAGTKHGPNIHCLLLDELHEIKEDLVNVLVPGTAARTQPLTGYLTTAPVMGESVCNDVLERAYAIRDGRQHDPSFLPCIWEATEDDDWTAEETWFKANPNLGKSIPLDRFREDAQKAINNPRLQNNFKRLRLNLRTEQLERWLDVGAWKKSSPVIDPVSWREETMERLKGRPCYAGFDLAYNNDFTDLELIFEEPDEVLTVLGFRWLPVDGQWRDNPHSSLFFTWADMGFVRFFDGKNMDYTDLEGEILEIFDDYKVLEVCADPTKHSWGLCKSLSRKLGIDFYKSPNLWTYMTEPCKKLEDLILAGKINHGGDPALTWMVGNVAKTESKDGLYFYPTKPKKNRHLKIDGVVTMLMALGRLVRHEGENQESYNWLRYDHEGKLLPGQAVL